MDLTVTVLAVVGHLRRAAQNRGNAPLWLALAKGRYQHSNDNLCLYHDTEIEDTRDNAPHWIKETAAVTGNPALNIGARWNTEHGLLQENNRLFDRLHNSSGLIEDADDHRNLDRQADQFLLILFPVIDLSARDDSTASALFVDLALGLLSISW